MILMPHLTTRLVPIEKKILATLWLLSTKETFRGVAERFKLNKGFLHGICMEVCRALKQVQPHFISWPTRQEQTQIVNNFLHKTGFPGVVGCIDGTHIPIPSPSNNKASYINQKGIASLQVQAVCDDNLCFLDVYTGWPGSVADAEVFRNSPLHNILENRSLDEEHHLLGDSAYVLSSYMMVPFRDNAHLTEIQLNYNICHSSARIVIEKAFSLLKSKFTRLQYLEMRLIEKIPLVILSCCVLHNFILLTEKIDSEFDIENIQIDENVPHEVAQEQGDIIAMTKRNALANLLT